MTGVVRGRFPRPSERGGEQETCEQENELLSHRSDLPQPRSSLVTCCPRHVAQRRHGTAAGRGEPNQSSRRTKAQCVRLCATRDAASLRSFRAIQAPAHDRAEGHGAEDAAQSEQLGSHGASSRVVNCYFGNTTAGRGHAPCWAGNRWRCMFWRESRQRAWRALVGGGKVRTTIAQAEKPGRVYRRGRAS
jgi:hypothetical protein